MTIMARPIIKNLQIWRQNHQHEFKISVCGHQCLARWLWSLVPPVEECGRQCSPVLSPATSFGAPMMDSAQWHLTTTSCYQMLGLKNATGWRKAEHQCQAEIERMTQAKEPIVFLPWCLAEDWWPCMFLLPVVDLADKAEKATTDWNNWTTLEITSSPPLNALTDVDGNFTRKMPQVQLTRKISKNTLG